MEAIEIQVPFVAGGGSYIFGVFAGVIVIMIAKWFIDILP